MDYFSIFIKKTLRYLLKPLSFLPALFMMYFIFSLSAQTGEQSGTLSFEVSKKIVLAYNRLFMKGYSNEILNQIIYQVHPLIRKTAHFTEYFVLAITVAFPLYVYKIRGIFLPLTGGVFCVLFAFLDEYHQSFVAGRGPSLRDVGIDSLGAFLGIFMAHLVCFIGRKTIFQFLSLEDYRKKKREYEKKLQEENAGV